MKILRNGDIGKLCLVKWDDVGRVESMLVQVDDDHRYGKVYDFNACVLRTVEASQVVEIGDRVTPNGILESQLA